MGLKKIVVCIFLCVIFLSVFQYPIYASGLSYEEQYNELLHSSGADKLFDIAPDDAKSILEDTELSELSSDSILQLSFFDFVSSIISNIKGAVTKPFSMLLSCIGIIFLCALLNSLKSSFNARSYEQAFSVVSVICIASVIIIPIAKLILKASEIIKQASEFLLSFVPVYMGIITASGKPISAMAYQTAVITVVQVISRISATVLVPLLGIYMAFCLMGSASREINVEAIARTVKNTVIIGLSFLMTIFVGLLSVQGTVAGSADSVTLRTAKFAVSAFLPVVGGAVSEALSSVQGCVGVIRGTVGSFGVITVFATFVPGIIAILMMQLALAVAGGISDALGTDKITTLLRCSGAVISLLLGIVVIFGVMLIISLGIMLTATG